MRERDANLLRRQLNRLEIDFSQFLEGRSLDELKPDELYTLAKFLPNFTQDYQLQVYTGILRESLEQRSVTVASSRTAFQNLRQKLGISDEAHSTILSQLQPLIQPSVNPDSTVLWRDKRNTDRDETVIRSDHQRDQN